MTLKHGTRIEVGGWDMQFNRTWEPATIYLRRKSDPLPGDGWHRVRFTDGGVLCVHEEGFRVVDNRVQ